MNQRKRTVLTEPEGKVPPSSVETENIVVGSMMVDSAALEAGLSILKEEFFYSEANSLIFGACKSLHAENKPVDIVSVTNRLRRDGTLNLVEGPWGVTSKTNRIASGANTEYHATHILELYGKRSVLTQSWQIAHDAYSEGTEFATLIDKAEQNLHNIREVLSKKSSTVTHVADMSKDVLADLLAIKKGEITGIPTGNETLNSLTSGWQGSDLIVVAARPGMGKTAWLLFRGMICALAGKPFVFFSIEMPKKQIIKRLLFMIAQVDNIKAKNGGFTEDELYRLEIARMKLNKLPIYIIDDPNMTVFDVRAKCREIMRKTGSKIGLIGLDYIQIMCSHDERKSQNRDAEISGITRGLKATAKELDVPMIALAQLSRDVEKSARNKRPKLHHLRESGSIEQDADMVILMYRPSYYYSYAARSNDEYYENNEVGITEETYNVRTELDIAKFRDGIPNTLVHERYKGEYYLFYTGNSPKDYLYEEKENTDSREDYIDAPY